MAEILVVCTANICRSPLGEAILQNKLRKNGYDLEVGSAGTWATQARAAARHSQRIAKSIGLDLTGHVAKMITREMSAETNLILVMTAGHKEAIQVDFPESASKVFLLSEMIGRTYDIPDPYGGPFEGYTEMHQTVNRLIEQGFDRIVELAQ